MSKLNTLHFAGADFFVSESELSPELFAALELCGHSGDQSDHVEAVRVRFGITGHPETCRHYLRGYGCWDDKELEDHTLNLARLIWLTGGDFQDGQTEAYFSIS